MRFYIGIDTGTNTAVAIWDAEAGRFLSLELLQMHQALDIVRAFADNNPEDVLVRFEDADQRRHGGWIPRGSTMREEIGRAIGAGMVIRDSHIWREALTDWKIPFEAVAPKNNITKMKADYFKALTKWQGRTNEHERDAAMLVFGRVAKKGTPKV